MAKLGKRVGAAGTAIAAFAYAGPLRRWMHDWGATEDEVKRAMPGDDVLPDAIDQSTRAISVAATPAAIWSWLAQMGDGRGGFYASAPLFRLMRLQHGQDAEKISPELQELKAGQEIPAGWTGLKVLKVVPNEAIVMERSGTGYRYTWTVAVYPRDSGAGTRLVSRYRYVGSKALLAVSEPIVFAFMRAWFSHVRERAERGPRA
jgi:hypothetical protein